MIASATVTAMLAIPGLQSLLTVSDMELSNITYNGLPRIHSDMGVSQEHVKTLVATIAEYGLRKQLGISLLHKHEDIPIRQINLGTKLKTVAGKWIRPVSIESLNLSEIHGTVFKFVQGENILVPYEFARGPSPVSMSDAVNNCVKDMLDYITTNGLVNVIALSSDILKDLV